MLWKLDICFHDFFCFKLLKNKTSAVHTLNYWQIIEKQDGYAYGITIF